MYLFFLGHERKTCKRIGVLAANKHPDSTQLRAGHAQSAPVAIRPDQLFIIGRHNLAMVVLYCAIGAD